MKKLNLVLIFFLFLPTWSPARSRVEQSIAAHEKVVQKNKDDFDRLPAKPQNKPWVREKLIVMVDVDQKTRALFSLPQKENYTETETQDFLKLLAAFMQRVDRENTEDLKHLLKYHSWFKVSDFGAESDSRAWLLVQHADHDRDFQ